MSLDPAPPSPSSHCSGGTHDPGDPGISGGTRQPGELSGDAWDCSDTSSSKAPATLEAQAAQQGHQEHHWKRQWRVESTAIQIQPEASQNQSTQSPT